MSLRAIGTNPPGFASVAPAATIAIAGEDEILLIFSIASAVRLGSRRRRSARTTYRSTNTPTSTSKIATHVAGVLELFEEAAASPSTKAATTPMINVTPNAPRSCALVVFLAYDPLAPGLYDRLGYETAGVTEGCPAGSAARWYRKNL
jgi:hypothetical protein